VKLGKCVDNVPKKSCLMTLGSRAILHIFQLFDGIYGSPVD